MLVITQEWSAKEQKNTRKIIFEGNSEKCYEFTKLYCQDHPVLTTIQSDGMIEIVPLIM